MHSVRIKKIEKSLQVISHSVIVRSYLNSLPPSGTGDHRRKQPGARAIELVGLRADEGPDHCYEAHRREPETYSELRTHIRR